jgi:hypothetical protein
MDMSDKPFFVRSCHSIPLVHIEKFGRNGTMRRIIRPLADWGQKIKAFRQEAQGMYGDGIRLVYLCPLNHNNSHFALVEVTSERKRSVTTI